MNVSGLLRRLKRRLRLKKRWLSLGSWLLLLMAAASFSWINGHAGHDPLSTVAPQAMETMQMKLAAHSNSNDPDPADTVLNRLKESLGLRETEVHKKFVCGEEIEPLGNLSTEQIVNLHRQHPQWKLELDRSGNVHFVESIHDLSAECKQNAYFGLDKNGNLSLFDGLPKDEKIIRTFFQLDVKFLKTSLPSETVQQLVQGIRVADLAEYNSVLSTFSTFAVGDRAA